MCITHLFVVYLDKYIFLVEIDIFYGPEGKYFKMINSRSPRNIFSFRHVTYMICTCSLTVALHAGGKSVGPKGFLINNCMDESFPFTSHTIAWKER